MGLDQGVLLLFVVAVAGFLQSGCTTVSDGINGTNTKPSHYPYSMPFNRTSFPAGFIFGAGSAAYQVRICICICVRESLLWIQLFSDISIAYYLAYLTFEKLF